MQSPVIRELKHFFKNGSVLSRLIGLNVLIFLIISILRVVFFLINEPVVTSIASKWFGLSSNLNVLLLRPWTIISYMFLHFDIMHILFNMIVLYVGGRLFSDFIGQDRLVPTYLFGGIAGGLFYVISFNIFPAFRDEVAYSLAIGASASVLSIFVAISAYMPNYRLPLIFLGSIRLKYIAIFLVVIDIISIDQGNPGGHLAHLGGASWGFLYAAMLKSGKDPARGLGLWLKALGGLFGKKPRMRVEYNRERPLTDEDYNDVRADDRKKMDLILDKISKSGYDSLSKEEKRFLFKMRDN